MPNAKMRRTGWMQSSDDRSLSDVHGSITVDRSASPFKRFLAFIGPGYLVAVGYMDPGNWATSLNGGAKFGYSLLFVILFSNMLAVLLQSMAARLAIASGRDLAQACRDSFPKPVAIFLWIMAELAIIATDLAEVIGTAIGLQLLFGLPLALGIPITALDVFLLLALQKLGFRSLEAFVMAVMALIAACFAIQIIMANPNWGSVLTGFIPTPALVRDPEMLYLAMGIIGATVMPHNLYLHSGIIQTRAAGSTIEEKREDLSFATLDSTLALSFALLINASILILATATFNGSGHDNVTELGEAHALLAPLLGSTIAPVLFAVSLIGCGLNSTLTATLSGQIVMEGFLSLRMAPWLRRLLTRLLAIIPAMIVGLIAGDHGTATLLILSQVVLSLQLPFAVIPLLLFVSSKSKMGALRAPVWQIVLGIMAALTIISLNIRLSADIISGLV